MAFELLQKALYQETENNESSSEMETESVTNSKKTHSALTPTKTYSESSQTLKKTKSGSKRSSSKKTSPKVKESVKSTPRRSKRLNSSSLKGQTGTDSEGGKSVSRGDGKGKSPGAFLSKSMRKAQEAEEAEEAMEKFIVDSESITQENVKFTYKIMNKYFETENKNYVTVDELWAYVQKKARKTEKGLTKTRRKMKKALFDLEDKGKIMISDSDVIYPM